MSPSHPKAWSRADAQVQASYQIEHMQGNHEASSQKWFVFLDADEIIDPWAFGRVVARLERDGEAGASLLALSRMRFNRSELDSNAELSGGDTAWIRTFGCSHATTCPTAGTEVDQASIGDWVRKTQLAPIDREVNTDYGIVLREDVLLQMPPYSLLHNLERSWVCAASVVRMWPSHMKLPLRGAIAPGWSETVQGNTLFLDRAFPPLERNATVMHLRDIRLSDHLLASKYVNRGELGITAAGFEHW